MYYKLLKWAAHKNLFLEFLEPFAFWYAERMELYSFEQLTDGDNIDSVPLTPTSVSLCHFLSCFKMNKEFT